MKHIRLLIAPFIAAPFFLTGCAAPLLIAAGAAGTGYLATQEEPAKKVDKFLQDLDKSIKQTTKKNFDKQPVEEITGEQPPGEITSEKPTEEIAGEQPVGNVAGKKPVGKQSYHHPQAGLIFTIQKASLSPDKVKKGEEVKLSLRYVITGAPAKGLKVTGKSTLSIDSKNLMVLEEKPTTKENGTWENTLTFAVPDSAQPGKYTIIQELSAQGLTRSSQRSFTVL